MIKSNLVNFLAPAAKKARLIGRGRLVPADQNLALPGMVGGADQAFVLHSLDQRGRPVIADAEPALDIARGGLAVAKHDGHGLVVELVAGLAEFLAALAVLLSVILLFGDGFEVSRHALL